MHATLLLRSGLDHAVAAGRELSAGSPYLPHTIGRTAAEHLARAQHHLDPTADDDERVVRRLNELLYAIHEGEFRRIAIVSQGHINEDESGRSRTELHADLKKRIATLGHQLQQPRRGPAFIAGTTGRATSMALVELYTAGTAQGVPSFTTRGASAVLHGTEQGLLSGAREESALATSNPHINVPVPGLLAPESLAFSMLNVLITVMNAADAIAERFNWPSDTTSERQRLKASGKAFSVWSDILNRD